MIDKKASRIKTDIQGRQVLVLLMIFLLTISGIAEAALISDQGTDVKTRSTGNVLLAGNLTISIYDSSVTGNLIFNQTFVDAIANGSWNLMMSPTLEFGKRYWKDYMINADDLDFNGSERLEFESSSGLINNLSFINLSLIDYGGYNVSRVNATAFQNESGILGIVSSFIRNFIQSVVVPYGGYNVSRVNATVFSNESGNLGVNYTYFREMQTNTSILFDTLVATDCSGTDKMTGVAVGGAVVCGADISGGGSSVFYNSSNVNTTVFTNQSGVLGVNVNYFAGLADQGYNVSRVNTTAFQNESGKLGVVYSYFKGIVDSIAVRNATSANFTGISLLNNFDLGWANLSNYPTACSGGQFVQGVGDTLTCATPSGGSARTFHELKENLNTINITVFNRTLFTLPVSASTNYTYECDLIGNTSVTTVGIWLNVSVPFSPLLSAVSFVNPTTGTAPLYTVCSGKQKNCNSQPTAGVVDQGAPISIKGRLINGINAGNIIITMRAEAAGTVIIKTGSYCFMESENPTN